MWAPQRGQGPPIAHPHPSPVSTDLHRTLQWSTPRITQPCRGVTDAAPSVRSAGIALRDQASPNRRQSDRMPIRRHFPILWRCGRVLTPNWMAMHGPPFRHPRIQIPTDRRLVIVNESLELDEWERGAERRSGGAEIDSRREVRYAPSPLGGGLAWEPTCFGVDRTALGGFPPTTGPPLSGARLIHKFLSISSASGRSPRPHIRPD